MKCIKLAAIALCLSSLLPSCGLVRTLVKLPVGVLKTATRAAGVSFLTDENTAPISQLEEEPSAE